MKKWFVYDWMPINGNKKRRRRFTTAIITANNKAEVRKLFLRRKDVLGGRYISIRRTN